MSFGFGLSTISSWLHSDWGEHGYPLQYSCLENPHGQRSLVGYSTCSLNESDTTKLLSTAYSDYIIFPGTSQKWFCVLPHALYQSLSHVWFFVTPWTVAHQAPLCMGFSRKNTGVGYHFLLQGVHYIRRKTTIFHLIKIMPALLPYCKVNKCFVLSILYKWPVLHENFP